MHHVAETDILTNRADTSPTGEKSLPYADLLSQRKTWGIIISKSLTDPVWYFITDWFAIYLVSRGFSIRIVNRGHVKAAIFGAPRHVRAHSAYADPAGSCPSGLRAACAARDSAAG